MAKIGCGAWDFQNENWNKLQEIFNVQQRLVDSMGGSVGVKSLMEQNAALQNAFQSSGVAEAIRGMDRAAWMANEVPVIESIKGTMDVLRSVDLNQFQTLEWGLQPAVSELLNAEKKWSWLYGQIPSLQMDAVPALDLASDLRRTVQSAIDAAIPYLPAETEENAELVVPLEETMRKARWDKEDIFKLINVLLVIATLLVTVYFGIAQTRPDPQTERLVEQNHQIIQQNEERLALEREQLEQDRALQETMEKLTVAIERLGDEAETLREAEEEIDL